MTLNPQLTIEYGEYLLGLPEDERRLAGETLNQRLAAAQSDEEVGRPPVRTIGEFLDDEIVTPPILVEPGLIAIGAINALTSRGGKGKTALSLNRLLRWSMGLPWFPNLDDAFKPVRPLRVLIVENEGSGGHFQGIIRTILHHNDFTPEQIELARTNAHIWGDGGWSGLKIDRDEDFEMVDRAVAMTEADILFVEPFRGLWRGDENNATEMGEVCDRMSEIANRHGCGVMLTHHERKSGAGDGADADPMSAARGSGVLEGVAATMERWVPVKGGKERQLEQVKYRFADPYAPVRLRFHRDRYGYEYVAEDENLRRVLAVLNKERGVEFTVATVNEEIEEGSEQRTRRWLNMLVEGDAWDVEAHNRANTKYYRLGGNGGNDAVDLP